MRAGDRKTKESNQTTSRAMQARHTQKSIDGEMFARYIQHSLKHGAKRHHHHHDHDHQHYHDSSHQELF